MSDLRVVRAEGDALTRGRTIGREISDLMANSIDFYHSYFDARGVTSPQLQDLLTPYMVAAEARTPELMALITGMAEGAMVPVMELFAVNAFEELEPLLSPVEGTTLFLERKEGKVDRCTSFAVSGDGYTLLGHNEQWLAGDTGNVAIILEVPGEGQASLASPTYACCIPAVGINSHGVAMGIQSMVANDDTVGVPRVLVSRHTLVAADRQDALHRSALEGRSGGYGYTVAARGGDTFTIETSAERQVLHEGDGGHTNHYLDQELASMSPKPSPGSASRLTRLRHLLSEHSPRTPEEAMAILSDHDSEPLAICMHPDPAEGDEAEGVVFSMVCELESKRMWVSNGLPCEAGYEEIDLSEAV